MVNFANKRHGGFKIRAYLCPQMPRLARLVEGQARKQDQTMTIHAETAHPRHVYAFLRIIPLSVQLICGDHKGCLGPEPECQEGALATVSARNRGMLHKLITYVFPGSTVPPMWSTIRCFISVGDQPKRQSQRNIYGFSAYYQVRQ